MSAVGTVPRGARQRASSPMRAMQRRGG